MAATFFLSIALIATLFAWVWRNRRQLFLLPSTWVLFLSTLIYVLPAAVFFEEIEDMSPYTGIALAYCTAFVVLGMVLNMLLARPPRLAELLSAPARPADATRATPADPRRVVRRTLRGLLLVLGLIGAWYLINVPLRSTGLYGVLFDPENSAQLREESLKLLDNPALQYVYLIGFSALSPLTLCMLLARLPQLPSRRRWWVATAVIAFLAFYLLITGARVGLVNLVVVGSLFMFVRNRLQVSLKMLVVATVIVFAVPIGMSILREQGRNEAMLQEYVEAIGERIFLLPLLISGWFVEYADTRGPAGLMAAIGLGEKLNWSNLIALEFLDRKEAVTVETVTTPTAFFFSNYLYFGWLGLLPSLIALRIIDLPVGQLPRLALPLRLPLIATLMFFSVIFVQSGFGVTLTTHGYLLLMLIVLWAARHQRPAYQRP